MPFLPTSRGGALWRFLLGAVIVVGVVAATTAVAGLLKVQDIVNALNETKPLKDLPVTLPSPGAPETLLLVGSDHRAGTPLSDARTDTMMLVRIDDSSSTINVLSIPRDLEVQLPAGGGVESGVKINASYADGGDRLLLQTLKHQVFPGLQVNHVIDITFRGFSDLIDAIGCVYADVDHRYYNLSAPGANDYSSIDIQPGYQRLCGDNQAPTGALAFVRFRHTDTDIVRSARQQDFIRWAKSNYSVGQLLANEPRLVRIFGRHVQTDAFLHSTNGLLELFALLINADKGHVIRSFPFPADLGSCPPCYVTSTAAAEKRVFRKFITPTIAAAKPSAPLPSSSKPHRSRRYTLPAGMTGSVGDGKSQAAQIDRVTMPVYFPKDIPSSAQYCFSITGNCNNVAEPASEYTRSYPRAYTVHDQGNRPHVAYAFTLVINSVFGRFMTIQGTTWKHPPILASPTKVQVINGHKLFEYYTGGRLPLVAYRTAHAVYWVSNTLDNFVPNAQMLATASSLTPAVG